MTTNIHTLHKQRGAATLIVSIILLLAITLMTFSGVRVGISEQRIAANDLRAKQATSVAEALIENGLGYLENNKSFISDTTSTNGWMNPAAPVNTPIGVPAGRKWQSCATTITAVPCGDGTANVYGPAWLFYTPPAAQMTAISTGVYPAAYTESVSFVTPNLNTVAAPVVDPFPTIHIIANVTPNADPLAGSAQVKQIAKAFRLSVSTPNNAVIALGSVTLSGSYKIWGNPTGLRTEVLSTTNVAAGAAAAADYIIAYNNRPTAVSAITGWTNATVARLSDQDDTDDSTIASSSSNPASFTVTVGNTAAYTVPITSVTIGVRARTATAGSGDLLDWGPVIASTTYPDTVTGTPSTPITLTTVWTDYYKTWTVNPATGVAWTVADIAALQAQILATRSTGAVTTAQVAEVWVDGYRVRYTVTVPGNPGGEQTVVETGFPLTVRSRNSTVTGGGSFDTCRNWANPVLPTTQTVPYTDWYPGGSNPDCRENTNPTQSFSVRDSIRSDVVSNDTTLPADLFEYIFGEPKENYQAIKAGATILANCDGLGANSTGIFWITGNCDPGNATYGTSDKPVIIIVEGNINLNGNPTIYGLLYSFSVPGTAGGTVNLVGNVVIIGAFLADRNVDFGTGSFSLVFKRSVLANLGEVAGAFAKVPGGWTDEL